MNASLLRQIVLLGGLVTLLFSLGVQPAFSHDGDDDDDDPGRTLPAVVGAAGHADPG